MPLPRRYVACVRPHLLIVLGLLTLTVAVFHPVRGHEFVNYDDREYVVENANLRAGLSLESAAGAFRPLATNWFPLNRLSLQLDHALFGVDPAGYHVTSLVLHAGAAVLLFLALVRMTGAPWRSAFVAGVFAIHPLHVESVAWVSERKDVLSGLFWMLALLLYARYVERPTALRMAGVAVTLALGLMAKPMLVTLPFVLLLLDFWPLGRLRPAPGRTWPDPARVRSAVVEKWPLFALVAASSAVTLAVQRAGGAMAFGDTLSFGTRAGGAVESLVVYVWKSVWPTDLAVFYPHSGSVGPAWRTGGASLIVVALSVGAIAARRAHPWLAVGWLWYVGTLVPVIGLVQVGMQSHADRYMYLPLVGLTLALAWGSFDRVGGSRAARLALGAAAVAALVALAGAAHVQVGHWRDTLTLFTRAAAVTGDNFVAERGLAKERLARGELAEAETHFRAALALRPGWSDGRLGLADVALQRGRVEVALREYEAVRRTDPGDDRAAGKLGLAFVRIGQADAARPLLAQALAANPGAPELHVGMALAAGAVGDYTAAERHGREALRLAPDLVPAANNLAWLLATCPDPDVRDGDEAIRLAETAQDASPSASPGILDTLAAGYAAAGRFEEAVRTATRAAELAEGRGAAELADRIRERAARYRSGRAWIEP